MVFLSRDLHDASNLDGLALACCTKFQNTLYIKGHISGGRITSICPVDDSALAFVHSTDGANFTLQAIYAAEPTPKLARFAISVDGRMPAVFSPMDMPDGDFAAGKLWNQFHAIIGKIDKPKLLDIGGRSRSAIDRSKMFPRADVTVLDVLPGENVHVVGDAHSMSDILPPESFDAVYSVAVFEHLLMPWKVAVEMNAVMKPGAIGFVVTHQTIGMHDMPWDFWRYSDRAWDGIFNEHTGFRILDRVLALPQFILPFKIRPEKMDSEKAAGFEYSAVLFQKTGAASAKWDVPMSIVDTMYPA